MKRQRPEEKMTRRTSKQSGAKAGTSRTREQQMDGRRRKRRAAEEEPVTEPVRRGRRKKEGKRGNRQIIAIAYCCVAVFFCLIGYLVRFMVCDSQEIINNPYNKRQELLAQRVVRGKILSADGEVLAQTVTDDDGNETREYPFDNMFCHVVGRTVNSMTGIESAQSFPLLTSHSNPLKQLANEFRGEKKQGDSVVTTLNYELQETAYEALGDQKGAVVAIEPSTGKILAMVSKPDYDPNKVTQEWNDLIEDSQDQSALLNRATQGLYPPGSTFKILTALEYMREHKDYKKYSYLCEGSTSIEGNAIRCYGGERHGTVNLKQSLAESCNCSFVNMGTQINLGRLHNLCERFMFNKKLPVAFEYNKSSFSLDKNSRTADMVQTVIGQGKTMITPLQNALISATIANGGEMMVPYLVDHTENDEGQAVRSYEPKSNGKIISASLSKKITKMMKSVVTDGTASSLSYLPFSVAGKTGTAEFDSQGTSHAWFVGFAPADHPKIAVSIIVEGAGTGSQYAVPIAKKMFENYEN